MWEIFALLEIFVFHYPCLKFIVHGKLGIPLPS